MSDPAPLYRAFLLDMDGRIYRFEYITAANDAEAIDKLGEIFSVNGIELWDRDRRVAHHLPAD